MIQKNKQFYVYNSFSKLPFQGNPAGVVPDAQDLNTETMQKIARQLNLVETVFIMPPGQTNAQYHFRYFTPLKELPITGHPTIAAAQFLYDQTERTEPYIVHTEGGLIHVRMNDGALLISQNNPVIKILDNALLPEIESTFGLNKGDIDTAYPTASVNTGLGHLIFCVKSLDALMKMKFTPEQLKKVCEKAEVSECQVFCFDTYDSALTAHTRNLCPRYGLEDAACGNGNAALGSYFSLFIKKDNNTFNFEQGNIINMPAIIHVETEKKDGEIKSVFIGGNAVKMIEGTVSI